MKTFLVVNPGSANGQTGRKWPELAGKISRAVGDFGHQFTERPMHAAELARDALERGYECIVAVGGDGTINEVVNGFFRDGEERALNPSAALGVIPRGTGGDFRTHVRLGARPRRLARPPREPGDPAVRRRQAHLHRSRGPPGDPLLREHLLLRRERRRRPGGERLEQDARRAALVHGREHEGAAPLQGPDGARLVRRQPGREDPGDHALGRERPLLRRRDVRRARPRTPRTASSTSPSGAATSCSTSR